MDRIRIIGIINLITSTGRRKNTFRCLWWALARLAGTDSCLAGRKYMEEIDRREGAQRSTSHTVVWHHLSPSRQQRTHTPTHPQCAITLPMEIHIENWIISETGSISIDVHSIANKNTERNTRDLCVNDVQGCTSACVLSFVTNTAHGNTFRLNVSETKTKCSSTQRYASPCIRIITQKHTVEWMRSDRLLKSQNRRRACYKLCIMRANERGRTRECVCVCVLCIHSNDTSFFFYFGHRIINCNNKTNTPNKKPKSNLLLLLRAFVSFLQLQNGYEL